MLFIGDTVRIKEGVDEYIITRSGSIGIVEEIRQYDIFFRIVSLTSHLNEHIGDGYYIMKKHVELVCPSMLQGPELPPVYLKIRSMYARQQAKGILRH